MAEIEIFEMIKKLPRVGTLETLGPHIIYTFIHMEVSNPWGCPNLSLGHHLFDAEPPDTRYNFVPRPSNDPPQRPGSICCIFESCQLSNLLIHRFISIPETYNSIQGCFSTLQHWEENQQVSLPFVLTYTPRIS